MMKLTLFVVVAALGLATVGCTGARPYKDVDLYQDLSRDTLARYGREWNAAQAGGSGKHMAQLEHTNWWPLGLVAYWRRGTVTRSGMGPAAPEYNVSSTLGVGPLSVLYTDQTHAKFTGDGKRVSSMTMRSWLWGHLAMFHTGDVILADGTRQKMWSAHLIHHILSIHRMNGHTSVSLFSMPNIIGVETSSHH